VRNSRHPAKINQEAFMEKNCLHLYTGNGKGKTTAAMGLALRMLGHGEPVLITQFMKDGNASEIKALATFPQAKIVEGAQIKGFIWRMGEEQKEKARQDIKASLDRLAEEIRAYKPKLIVLDELAVALSTGMIDAADAWQLIDTALEYGETVVTGRYAGKRLKEKADYVSSIEPVKHPFNEGQPARKGIEF
jgi:cob(I)alamin adenosyltransferase